MRDEAYLDHIRDAIQAIMEYTEDVSRDEFMEDSKTQDAVVRQFEILGEAAKQVSDKTKQELDRVPWQDIAGMRDRLIHGYFNVDDDIVWETIQQDLPELQEAVERFVVEDG